MWSVDRYREALRYAASAHGDQRVPGSGHPYVVHVVSVASEVIAAGGDDLAVTCALLHDVVEDTAVTADEVERAFGRQVREGVVALSKDPNAANKLADSLQRIRRQPRSIWMVKLADRVVNLTPPVPPKWDAAKRARYRDEGEEIYAALHEANDTLAKRLRQRIEEYPL